MVGRSGTLYVVATPLGNLGDLSPRAAELLRTVPVVAAEDTRVSRGLLAHLDAHPRLVAFHQHSDASRADALIKILREGEDIALVTDAGTPGVSDPGPFLVEGVRAAGFTVVPIPGPSAVTAAISVSGFPADRYLFLGFAPRKGPERDRWLRQAATPGVTVVCFEAPNRVEELLRELARLFPDIPLVEVPLDHPIYHIVYDLPRGTPKGHEHAGKPAPIPMPPASSPPNSSPPGAPSATWCAKWPTGRGWPAMSCMTSCTR